MKDEFHGIPISEYIGLRSKMYSISCNDVIKKRANDVKKCVVKNILRHETYKSVLINKLQRKDQQSMIRSINNELYTIQQSKISLSCFDDKRWIQDDGIHTLAYGHVSIK